MSSLNAALQELGLPSSSRKIYLSLLEKGDASARLLANRTGITRTSVYDHTRTLIRRGLIIEMDIGGKTFFSVADPQKIDLLLSERIEALTVQKKVLKSKLPTLISAHAVQPKVRYFEKSDGMQTMLKDMLWYTDITLYILWSYEHMLEVLGPDFLTWFNKRRERNNISVQSLWPKGMKNKKHIFIENDALVSRRYLPNNLMPVMSYIVYENSTIYISSAKEAFGFTVVSREHADLMRMQFNTLWNISKKNFR